MNAFDRFRPLATMIVLGLLALPTAQADSDQMLPRDMPAAYVQECASCHTAYPPGMLPARSWQHIMGNLNRHYGSDASLDDAAVRQLSKWLLANAGTYKRVAETPPEDRITRSAWFVRKHDDIAPAVWKLPSVKSTANCIACHTQADRGSYDDDNLRFPAGLDARSRRAWND